MSIRWLTRDRWDGTVTLEWWIHGGTVQVVQGLQSKAQAHQKVRELNFELKHPIMPL
jgi:hypothetical protein